MSQFTKNYKKTKNRETKKIKKLLNEEIRLGLRDESNSDAEEVDLSKDVYPLSHYIGKKEEMVEQMFTIISDNSLKKILPPLLKDLSLDELKAECLIHLLGMSRKRIISILEGKEIDSSSESDTHSEASPSHENTTVKKGTANTFALKQDGCSDISNDSDEFENEELKTELQRKGTKNTSTHDKPGDSKTSKSKKRKSQTQDVGKKKKQTKVQNSATEDTKKPDSSVEPVDDDSAEEKPADVGETQGKTLLDILELELRAKAIRALLEHSGEEHGNHRDNEIDKEEREKSLLVKPKESVKNKKDKIKIERNYRKHNSATDKIEKTDQSGLVTIDLTNDGESSKVKEDQNKEELIKVSGVDEVKANDNAVSDTDNEAAKESTFTDVQVASSSCVTEPSVNKTEEITESPQTVAPRTSWADRWLQSKDVNKVVSTSKMCANIRKRMRIARLAKQQHKQSRSSSNGEQEIRRVEGSVTEYQLLTQSQNINISEGKTLDESKDISEDNKHAGNQDSIPETQCEKSKECASNDGVEEGLTSGIGLEALEGQ